MRKTIKSLLGPRLVHGLRRTREVIRVAIEDGPLAGPLKRCDVRRQEHRPGNVLSAYGTDESGTVIYRFNAQGYRGEEYDPDAAFRICVIGESHAFGTGVAQEQTFGNRFADHLAAALGIDRARVNLLNLSVGGVSPDYCVRTLYRQLPGVAADVALVHMPGIDRMEFYDGTGFSGFGVSALDPDRIDEAPPPLLGFCDLYNAHLGRLALAKNLLLAQSLLEEQGIDYVISIPNLPPLESRFGYLHPYMSRLDQTPILHHKLLASRLDKAADGRHGGPRTHGAIAIALLSHYGETLAHRGARERAELVRAHARTLMDNDPDWAFARRQVRLDALERAS